MVGLVLDQYLRARVGEMWESGGGILEEVVVVCMRLGDVPVEGSLFRRGFLGCVAFDILLFLVAWLSDFCFGEGGIVAQI